MDKKDVSAEQLYENICKEFEDEWAAMSYEESCQWLDHYITQYGLAKEDNQ